MSERAQAGGTAAALVRVLWVPARGDPDHRSEMVTQWLCGEALSIVGSRGGWSRARGEDDYEAWAPTAALEATPAADAWEAGAAVSLGTLLSEAGGFRRYLPWGARVRRIGEDLVELPDGSTARPSEPDRIVAADERARRFPRSPDAVVETARRWKGIPYVWGGRTDTGCDCSGFVQAVFGTHGLALPRDSDQQGELGERLPDNGFGSGDLRPADLLFFAPEGRGITHVAISAGGSRIVHCAAGRGAVAEDDLSAEGEYERSLLESMVLATRPVKGRAP